MSLDVLVPHFRDLEGLALSLASVAAQGWTGDLRLVIVDDGSPEAEFGAVEALAAEQPLPVTLARNPENRGRPYTRNRLLDMVEADYVAWLDSGDIWYPTKLESQFDHLSRLRFQGEDLSRVWVTCHYDWQWTGRQARYTVQKVAPEPLKELLLGADLRAYLWTLLGSAETFRAVGRFDQRLPRLQDLDYFIRFLRAGGILAVPPQQEALCCYHKSDLGRNAAEIRRCNRLVFEKYRTSFERYGPDFLAMVHYNAETLSARYAKNNDDQVSRAYYLLRAFAANPRRSLGLARRWIAQGGS
jgi:glycosyltransferase involved in cell wall biosynthesis